jgi:hypothetical protein
LEIDVASQGATEEAIENLKSERRLEAADQAHIDVKDWEKLG